MLNFTGKEIGDRYFEESKFSLTRCNYFDITEDQKSMGTFISGYHHSGKRYFSFIIYGETYTVKAGEGSFLKNKFLIFQRTDGQQIGYFEVAKWKWFNGNNRLCLIQSGEVYQFREVFGILTKLWKHQRDTVMRWNDNVIRYSYRFDTEIFYNNTCTGVITIDGKPQLLYAILGLLFIDTKFRKWALNAVE